MHIECCYKCVAPKRHPGCHDKCKEYLKEKAKHEEEKKWTKEHMPANISSYDFDKMSLYKIGKR